MKRNLELIVQNTVKSLEEMKAYQKYLRNMQNPYLTIEEWREKNK